MKYSNQFFVSFCNKYGFKTIKQYLDYIGDYLNDLNIAAMNNKDNALYDIKSNYIKFLYTNDFIAEPLYLAGVQGVNEPLLTFKIGKHTFHQPTRLCKYIEFLKLKHDTTKFSKNNRTATYLFVDHLIHFTDLAVVENYEKLTNEEDEKIKAILKAKNIPVSKTNIRIFKLARAN